MLITHQDNNQVKDNKIDLLVQQYEQFVISEDESIVSAFARFNIIITSLKALDEGYSSKNYVRKFLRALHPKWRAKVTAIEESKYLTSLSLDELIGNLKVHEMIIKKDSKIVKAKGERKSLALKAKKKSSDEECSASESSFVEKNNPRKRQKDIPRRPISECPKPPKDNNQRAFIEGSWSDSGEEDAENAKDETCLMAQASNEAKGLGFTSFNLATWQALNGWLSYHLMHVWFLVLAIFFPPCKPSRSETHVSASVKEIDNVQLGIVSQVELKLQPRVLLQFLYRCIH
ncbi:hypothetical protein Tco_0966165 [Tanacetum coccineum]